jgi:5-methylthioadenosine/S-adenosylhomocysteine deaminase
MNQVDLILTNAVVVTMDDGYQLFPNGGLAVKGDSIVSVGTSADVRASCSASEVVDCGGRALIPGLVNAHTHVPMALLRGMVDDERLDVWLMGYMMPVEREFVTPEFCREGARLACAEMIRGGTTTFADMYYYEDAVAEAVAEAGMRAVCSQAVMKFPSPDASSYEDSLAAARDLIERWRDHPLIVPSVAPHAPYTCTAEIMHAASELAMEHDVPVHIHLAETSQEVEQWRETTGLPIIPWVEQQGLFEAKVIAAHCVHVDLGEVRRLGRKGVGVAHNPSSNMKLASGFAPVSAMVEAGVHVGLGTDGPASNNDLDMFEEMRLATFMAKAVTSDPTALPARTTFAMATRWGAKALHLDDVTGSLEPGKRADLVLVDVAQLHNVPQFVRDPDAIYSQLVYAGKASDVTDVMVNGKWLLRERALQTIEEASVMSAASSYAHRIDTFLREREDSVLSKLVAIGNAEQEESHEVQIKVRLDDAQPILEKLQSGVVDIVRTAHYIEYDLYFSFGDPTQGRLRYREDQFIDKAGNVVEERARLTLTGPAAERDDRSLVRLSRSRFIAPARHSARFYREYFKPVAETTVQKDRLRWLVSFRDREFFINIDELQEPKLGTFLEIKSRTWSRHDAQEKAGLILELLELLDMKDTVAVAEEYPDLHV